MNRDQQIEAFTNTLTANYDMPEEFANGLAEFLYDEDYRKIFEASWLVESEDSVRCSCCCFNRSSIKIPLDFCPRCGAKIIGHKESNSLDTLFDEVDMGTCSNKTYNDIGLVTIS